MRYGSVCSGIEAATVAWHPLGWEPQFFSEIEPFPCSALAHHYPDVPNYGDMTKFKEWPDAAIDVLIGGTPCQSYSVAGLRAGLDDPRGDLMLTYVAIARKYRPSWVVWENVPGVLSSNQGRDFGSLLGLLTGQRIECPPTGWQNSGVIPGYKGAYGIAWRVLDAQFVRVDSHPRAVPQRRRRVFVVGYLGDWRRACAALFERESLSGNPAPSRKTGEEVAGAIRAGTPSGGPECFGIDEECNASVNHFGPLLRGGQGGTRQAVAIGCHTTGAGYWQEGKTSGTLRAREQDSHENVVCMSAGQARSEAVAGTLNANGKAAGSATQQDAENGMLVIQETAHTLRGEGFDASEDGTGRGTPLVPVMAFSAKDYGADAVVDVSPTLRAGNSHRSHANSGNWMAIQQHWSVRRLTTTECGRLQGFKDSYLDINHKGKPAADGPKYKAFGNSMATNVIQWIGRRIQMVDEL